MMPAVEMVRLVSSGTEATMSAVRLARAYTRREKIIKIEGCYHGHGDSFLIKAGSGLTTLGEPNSPGVPRSVSADTLIAPFNDAAAVKALFTAFPGEIAALIVEPVPANMGVILPAPGYLAALREMTREYGSLLIFDEVITGFRVHPGGAQGYFGITPDLTTLGKIIGGGLPIGAYGGRREIMALMSPQGPVYQAGTLSGNPLAVSAGIATLATIRNENVIDAVNAKAETFHRRVEALVAASGVALCTNRIGSMSTLFFQKGPVRNYQEAVRSDPEQFKVFFGAMLDQGIYMAPSQYEAAFVSLAHTPQDLADACQAMEMALARVRAMAR
jgi:glutamate-1-semialdehyde 2,1-aminomutase